MRHGRPFACGRAVTGVATTLSGGAPAGMGGAIRGGASGPANGPEGGGPRGAQAFLRA